MVVPVTLGEESTQYISIDTLRRVAAGFIICEGTDSKGKPKEDYERPCSAHAEVLHLKREVDEWKSLANEWQIRCAEEIDAASNCKCSQEPGQFNRTRTMCLTHQFIAEAHDSGSVEEAIRACSPEAGYSMGATYGSDSRRLDAPTQIPDFEMHHKRARIEEWEMLRAGMHGRVAGEEGEPSNTK
jgi:hypothetical protein